MFALSEGDPNPRKVVVEAALMVPEAMSTPRSQYSFLKEQYRCQCVCESAFEVAVCSNQRISSCLQRLGLGNRPLDYVDFRFYFSCGP